MPEHVVVIAVIVQDGQVLLAHRHPHRTWYPDCWDLVGGHVEADESALDALQRECHEELGITISEACRIEMPSADPQITAHAFLVTDWSGELRNLAPDEHDDLKWFAPADLASLQLADPAMLSALLQVLGARA